eukprot:TRINITY_DN10165_c0_g1_i1.p1 TRINITY_DN10165_c0_g1~~TRINITY_DN10165_c0_g1_i1.p1  ORF type:complete len:493 (-),score=109.72 TRINITY_DN10165_c0_g1_i1:11-1489(-)
MKRLIVCMVVLAFVCGVAQSARVSRITPLLTLLQKNGANDPATSQPKLHNAFYASEILNVLGKHAGYIQSEAITASFFVNKMALFATSLQITTKGEDQNFGGFQTFPGEEDTFGAPYTDQMTTTTATSYYAGRVLEIGSSELAIDSNHFDDNICSAALSFLEASADGGVFRLNPVSDKTISSVYYGTLAWKLWAARSSQDVSDVNAAAISSFISGQYSAGGFAATGTSADLRTTFEALATLQAVNGLKAFLSANPSAQKDISAFVGKHSSDEGGFSAVAGGSADAVSTFYAIKIGELIGASSVDKVAASEFLLSLQTNDGSFKLRSSNTVGHYSNTYFALNALEALKTTNKLEVSRDVSDPIVLPISFTPVVTVYVIVLLALALFAAVLFMMSSSDEEDEEDEEENYAAQKVSKKQEKLIKKDPVITLIRDNANGKLVDEDGEDFPSSTLSPTEWDIISKEERETTTVYKIRKIDGKRRTPDVRVRRRGRKS